ncbi:MAG: hypothetical protein HDS89_04125 [Bacteroidales bacterium]|nr:hypothetical protein [Bacteroidales bacterium]
MNSNPFYREPAHPSHLRRALHHDYKRPARYMITLHKSSYLPNLSTISGNLSIKASTHPDAPKATPTPTGSVFYEAIRNWHTQYPQLQIEELVIMPDHIHFCLNVRHYLQSGLSRAISNLMGKTTSAYKALLRSSGQIEIPNIEEFHFFAKGFNDSIAYTDEQYQAQREYILDNPRRLLMKRNYPDLYRMRWIITAGNIQVMALGNIHLLKNPHLQVVRFSRKFDQAKLAENRIAYRRCVENGGAMISPYIHPKEKAVRDHAIKEGGNIIRICDNGFSERFAPSKSEFELMGTRRLLLIAPMQYNSRKQDMKYTYAQQLNRLAEFLASHPSDLRITPAK